MMARAAVFSCVKGYQLLQVLVMTLFLFTDVVLALKLTKVVVPVYKVRGEMATLECQYDLEGDKLYSVKWYKDNEEFYRFVPSSEKVKQSYKVEGVRVEHDASTDKKVILKNLTLKSSGMYSCEVSAEKPKFSSAMDGGWMEVVYVPKDGPYITGEEDHYEVGDELRINCTSGKSYPAAELNWFVNDEKVTSQEALIPYPEVSHPHGLIVTTLGLSFKVTSRHLQTGKMMIKCLACVWPMLRQEDRESYVQQLSPLKEKIMREALIRVKGSSSQCSSGVVFIAVLAFLLLLAVV